jgi:hypothetical protein
VFVSSTTAAQPYTNVLTASGACETIGFTFFNREERSATQPVPTSRRCPRPARRTPVLGVERPVDPQRSPRRINPPPTIAGGTGVSSKRSYWARSTDHANDHSPTSQKRLGHA